MAPRETKKMQQLQYRSFHHDILIYHYTHYLLDLKAFERYCFASRNETGYTARLVSNDLVKDHPVSEGDEVPEGRYEAGYLPRAFHGKGSAIGIRVPSHRRSRCMIQWFCFKQSAEEFLERFQVVMGVYLFDKVAIVEKGGSGKKGTVSGVKEHRDWFEALEQAWYPPVKLTLTWKNRAKDRKAYLDTRLNGRIDPDEDDEVPEEQDCTGVEVGMPKHARLREHRAARYEEPCDSSEESDEEEELNSEGTSSLQVSKPPPPLPFRLPHPRVLQLRQSRLA